MSNESQCNDCFDGDHCEGKVYKGKVNKCQCECVPNFNDKIENVIKVFIVVRRKAKIVRPEIVTLNDEPYSKLLAVFPNRKQAKLWINWWYNGEDVYDILERKLA